MPFANFKTPQATLTKAQKEELVHRTTQMFVDVFANIVRSLPSAAKTRAICIATRPPAKAGGSEDKKRATR